MKYNFRVLLLTLFVTGCKESIPNIIITRIEDQCDMRGGTNCTLVMKDVTPFQWDRLYIFPDWTISDSISKTIGFPYDGSDVEDDYTRMLFTSGETVVHEEDFRSMDLSNSTIIFAGLEDSLGQQRRQFLSPSQAIFSVVRDKSIDGCKRCFVYGSRLMKRH